MTARDDPRRSQRATWIERAARLGYVARGLVYVVVGGIALQVAVGTGEPAGRLGAIRAVAERPLGNAMLLAAAAGFGGYALWRWLQALRHLRDLPDLRAAWHAVFYAVRGGFYALTAWYAAAIAVTAERGGPPDTPLLRLPPAAVVLGGLAALGYATFLAHRGVTRGFRSDLRSDELPEPVRRPVEAAGVAGYLSRATAIGVAAGIAVAAGAGIDPAEDLGLDRALAALAAAAGGPVLLGVIAAGLTGFGLFSFVEARYRRIRMR